MLRKFGSHLRNQWMGAGLFLVLTGGTRYAVTQIDRNSVKSKHIVSRQVKSVDVEDQGLTGQDIAEASLQGVHVDTLEASEASLPVGPGHDGEQHDATSYLSVDGISFRAGE